MEMTLIASVMMLDSRTKTMRLFRGSGQALAVMRRQVMGAKGTNDAEKECSEARGMLTVEQVWPDTE